MTAYEELDQIEKTTDWTALIVLALSDPPNPRELVFRHSRWGQLFTLIHGRDPLPTEYQPGVYAFLRKLALAAIPPELVAWVDSFEQEHKRTPSKEELPTRLRDMLPSEGKKGRPRCDTQRLRNAARAWNTEIARTSYDLRREGIEIGREGGFDSCFGFNQASMQGDRPNLLAIAKLAGEWGTSEEYIRDVIFPDRRRK